MPEQVPSQLGRYRILGVLRHVEINLLHSVDDQIIPRLAQIATLYQGRDELLGDVTIKIPSPAVADEGGGRDLERELMELRQRFYREAQITGRLDHPNVSRAFDVGEQLGIPYIVFEPLKGRTLQDAIEAGISLRVSLPVIVEALAGLAYVHEQGIVHRDINPANIFIQAGGSVKITGFHMARTITATSFLRFSVFCTRDYVSPEQVKTPAPTVDGRSDLFSVGCILFALVTGLRPFHADRIEDLVYKVIHEEPEMELIPDGREWTRLRGVIVRALQKKPEDRYPDATAMREDLELALMELGDSGDWTPKLPRGPAGPLLH